MECPSDKCHHWVKWNEMICSSCNTPLYKGIILSPVIYSNGSATLSIRLENRGINSFIVSHLVLNGESFRCEDEKVKPEQSLPWKPILSDKVGNGKFTLGLKVWFQGKMEDLPIEGGQVLEILPWPELQLPATLEIRPSNRFKVALPITLVNDRKTHCLIDSLEIQDQHGQLLECEVMGEDSKPLGAGRHLELGEIVNQETCTIVDQETLTLSFGAETIERMSLGNNSLLVRLKGHDKAVFYEKNLTLRLYSVPDIHLDSGHWGKKGYEFNSHKDTGTIRWRAPAGDRARKRLHLKANVSGDFVERDVEATLNSPVATFTGDGMKQRRITFWEEKDIDVEILEMEGQEPLQEKHFQDSELTVESLKGRNLYSIRLERFQAEKAQTKLSLDFGTTACCVAILTPDDKGKFVDIQKIHTIPIDYSKPPDSELLPSVVSRVENRILVGKEAVGGNFEPVKTEMFQGENEEIKARCRNDAQVIMETCLRRTMDWLIDQPEVKRILFKELVLAVPTSFPLPWKQKLHDLCLAAGRKVFGATRVSIVEESMAALRYFLGNPTNQKDLDLVVICDFGGGSTDITFLETWGNDGQPRYRPLIHGGMRDFAGYQIDKIIQKWVKEHLDKHIDIFTAENIKKSLGNQKSFSNFLQKNLRITLDTDKERAWVDLRDLIRQKVLTQFINCLKPLIARASKKLAGSTADRKVLLLLAGNGSRLANFGSHLKEAWISAVEAVPTFFGQVSVRVLDEPKKSVAIGGYLSTVHEQPGTLLGLQNTVPEDLLMGMWTGFTPSDPNRVITSKDTAFYLLFEAGDLLTDQSNEISTTIPATNLGLEGTPKEISLEIYACLPGETPMRYNTLMCSLPPEKKTWGDLMFIYSPGNEDELVTVKCL